MFSHISMITYGRTIKGNEWACKNVCGLNRLHFIHSGSVLTTTGGIHMINPDKLYIYPQNLEFNLLRDENTCVDHSFVDFITIPPIKMDDLMEIDPKNHPLIESALKILIDLVDTYPMYPLGERNDYYDLIKSYLNNLLFLINNEIGLSIISDLAVITALDYIHNNFSRDISIDEIATKLNYHKNFFIKKFKKIMAVTPYQYIINYRLNMALDLIKGGTYNIKEIAGMVGYCDASSFSRAFKKIYGIYPAEASEYMRKL